MEIDLQVSGRGKNVFAAYIFFCSQVKIVPNILEKQLFSEKKLNSKIQKN